MAKKKETTGSETKVAAKKTTTKKTVALKVSDTMTEVLEALAAGTPDKNDKVTCTFPTELIASLKSEHELHETELVSERLNASKFEGELFRMTEGNNRLKQELGRLSRELESAKVTPKKVSVFRYIARYDNVQLDGITLNNLKACIFEVRAESNEEADAKFEENLKNTAGVATEAELLSLKKKMFGKKIIVERESVEPEAATEVRYINV